MIDWEGITFLNGRVPHVTCCLFTGYKDRQMQKKRGESNPNWEKSHYSSKICKNILKLKGSWKEESQRCILISLFKVYQLKMGSNCSVMREPKVVNEMGFL